MVMTMPCIKCGADLPQGAVFCCYCGKKQISEPAVRRKSRGNGTGTVYKRSGGWCAEVTLGYIYRDGKRIRKHRRKQGFKTKKAALSYLEDLAAAAEKKYITVGELWTMLQPDLAGLSESKQTAYGIAWKKIAPSIEHRRIDTLTVPELQELAVEVAPTFYPRRDVKALLSKLYQLAIRDDYIDKNRAVHIKLPTLEEKDREVFTEDDIAALWADYRKSPSLIVGEMLIMLYTGIRPGELLTIKAENIHLDEHYMTGGIKTKKGKRRKIIIPSKLEPVIVHALASARDGLLAYYPYKNAFYDTWIEKRTALGLSEALEPYCCRHTYITRLTALGVSPAMLQELAGHEDYDTTLDYTHLSVADRLAQVDRMV